ncbi:hypothetical protein D3C77_550530 [compost metagenome]
MSAINTLGQVQHLLDGIGRNENGAAFVGDYVVAFLNLHAGHANFDGRVDLYEPVARADHRHTAAEDRVADVGAAAYIAAEAVDDRATDTFALSCIGQDVAPAGNTVDATRDHQHAVIARDLFHNRGNQVNSGCHVLLGAQLHGAGTTDDFRAVPERHQAIGGAREFEEVQRVRHRVGIKRCQALKRGFEAHRLQTSCG